MEPHTDPEGGPSLPGEIARLLGPLDQDEREVLPMRFGFDRGEPRTLEEVADTPNSPARDPPGRYRRDGEGRR